MCFKSWKNGDIVKLDLNVLYIRYLSLVAMESVFVSVTPVKLVRHDCVAQMSNTALANLSVLLFIAKERTNMTAPYNLVFYAKSTSTVTSGLIDWLKFIS